MKTHANSLNTFYQIFDWIFPVYFLIYFIEFYLGFWRLSTLVKLAVILVTIYYSGRIVRHISSKGDFFKLFTFYYLYCTFSIIWYSVNGVPINCYLNEFFNSLPAMFFVYVGMADKRGNGKFFERFVRFCSIAMLIGLLLYLTTPSWYVQRSVEVYENQWFQGSVSEDSLLATMRFCGFFKSVYEADMYAMVALSAALFFFYSNQKRGNDILIYLMILINLVAAILTQQRIAMVSASFSFIFYIIYGFVRKKEKKSSKIIVRTLFISVCLLAFVVAFMGDRIEQIQLLLEDRKDNMNIATAMSERANQHETIWQNWSLPIFGLGAGSGGSTAGFYHLPHINDGGYLQLLYEYGVVGFFFFLLIMIKTLFRAIRYLKYYLTEIVIICFLLVAMIGSNTLTLGFMITIPFWYSVGRIWNIEHRNYIIDNRIKV